MNKTKVILEKHFKKFKENKTRDTLKQIQVKEDGTFVFCSQDRFVRVKNVVVAGEEYYIPAGIEGKYPDVSRLIPNGVENTVNIPVKDVKKMVEAVSIVLDAVKITINSKRIEFTPLAKAGHAGSSFVEATYIYDQTVDHDIQFNISTKYLKEMLILFSQLKQNTINIQFVSDIRPILFCTDEIEYLISPIRVGE